MIFLYTLLVLLLGTAGAVLRRRAARLERKFARAALDVDRLAREPQFKEGNGSRGDPCRTAKRQYLLGQLVQKRDRLEDKHYFWQRLSDKVTRLAGRVGAWRGKKLPYTCGVLDVGFALWLADALGAGERISARRLVELITSWFSTG